jgi:hypothetical protein
MTEMAGWETLPESEAIAELPNLSDAQLVWVAAWESGEGGRTAVLTAATNIHNERRGAPQPAGALPRVNPRDVKDI